MLTHTLSQPTAPQRVVVLGANGFVSGELVRRLQEQGVPVLPLGRNELDLLSPDAAANLAPHLRPDDALVFVSALAPCKNPAMLAQNLAMANAVAAALKERPVAHVVYVSSDAVYMDIAEPMTEATPAAPGSLHGVMHLARELILQSELGGKVPLALLRPTLIYGARDPHNGYGPNRFARLAAKGEEIVFFGNGEERRDHVSIADVGALLVGILFRRSTGILNAVSGEVVSFREAAEWIVKESGSKSVLRATPRSGPMPHNGYRAFDPAARRAAFPEIPVTPWREGLRTLTISILRPL